MKPHELAVYKELVMGASYGEFTRTCFLCLEVFATGERLLMVPTNCDETKKMDVGQPYDHLLAHRSCMERIP